MLPDGPLLIAFCDPGKLIPDMLRPVLETHIVLVGLDSFFGEFGSWMVQMDAMDAVNLTQQWMKGGQS